MCMTSLETKWRHIYLVLKFRILDCIEIAVPSMNGVWKVY